MANVAHKGYSLKFDYKKDLWCFAVTMMRGDVEIFRDSPPVSFKKYSEALEFATGYCDDLIADKMEE